ncbi:MAG TPA: NAD-dependent epimerase/dehydratase family protein [Phycisphaerae bacterium]|nr:NAD-dependent epimerase/dehydratase family protein [Phycisphaerae bacterium]
MPHALVTGAAGFIGSHVSEALLGAGWRVTGLDSFDPLYDPAVKRANVAACLGHKGFELTEGDIRDREAAERCMGRGVDVVVHLAALAGVRPSIERPRDYQDVNVTGTCCLLEAARKLGVSKFVFASSSSVYGNNPKVPFAENDNVDFPISPYAASKKSGELICHAYHHLYGMDATCLRFFTVYGPRQRPDLAIHRFSRLIEAGRPITVFGDGSSSRDYTYVGDVVTGVLAAIERCRGYRIYNLGNSLPVVLGDLITAIERALGRKAVIERRPDQPGDVDRTFADISRARAELGYEPKTRLEDGLRMFVGWLRTEGAAWPAVSIDRQGG